jgi:hypothetical protein
MRLPTLSRRKKFESIALLVAGLAAVAVAILLMAMHSFPSETQVAVAFCFWFCGCIFIGAGALSPFRLVLSGAWAGLIVGAYLMMTPINSDGINANETFLEVAEKIAATHAQSDEKSDEASASPPQISPSDWSQAPTE